MDGSACVRNMSIAEKLPFVTYNSEGIVPHVTCSEYLDVKPSSIRLCLH